MGTTTNSASTLRPAATTKPTAPRPSPHQLPDEPLIRIRSRQRWSAPNLGELWAHRELLYFLIWRDLKVRYKQTIIGVAWVVLQPLLMTIIFTVVLGKLARVPSDNVPYPLLVYSGLLPWTFFSSAVMNGGNSLISNAHLITKVYFPRLIVPAAAVGARVVDLGISFVLLIGLMLYYQVPLTRNVVVLPALVLLMTLLALALGVLISALNVKYRDVGVALPVLVQLWMFISPVLYPLSLVPASWRRVYALNPLVGVVDGFRVSLLGGTFDLFALSVTAISTIVLLMCSVYMFRRAEKNFADVI